MQESLEFATAVADTVSFVLVTPDLFGKERVSSAGARIERMIASLFRLSGRTLVWLLNGKLLAPFFLGLLALLLIGWTDSWEKLPTVVRPLLAGVIIFPFFFVLAAIVILGCGFFAFGIVRVLKRYNFNGILLAVGAVVFLTTRGLIMYDTWPHPVHAATVVNQEHVEAGGASAHPAEQS
jgi:hypothetical protein